MRERLFLLDTSIVVALVRGRALASHIDERFNLRKLRNRPLVSIVSKAEVRVLANRYNWGLKKLQSLQNALGELVTVDIAHPMVIDSYVDIDIYSQSHADGARNMGKNDLWIAACAKTAGATLITMDKDFEHLDPEILKVEYVDQEAFRQT